MSFPIEPIHSNVLIKQLDTSEKMYGNIIIPDAGKEKPLMGKVLASGPGYYTFAGQIIPNVAKADDIVFFPSFGGTKISYGDEEYVICKDQDLLAILKEDKKVIPNHEVIAEILKETEDVYNSDPLARMIQKSL